MGPCYDRRYEKAGFSLSDDEVSSETERWLSYAREELAVAEAMFAARQPSRICCFQSQQAAEKALKAAWVKLGVEHPYTHDLVVLNGSLPAAERVDIQDRDLAWLTRWALERRYPGEATDAAAADAERSIAIARAVVRRIETRVASRSKASPGEGRE